MPTKYVHAEFAYPTSPLAAKFGHGKTGCWYIAVTNDKGTPVEFRHVKSTFPTDEERPNLKARARTAEAVRSMIGKLDLTPGYIHELLLETVYLRDFIK